MTGSLCHEGLKVSNLRFESELSFCFARSITDSLCRSYDNQKDCLGQIKPTHPCTNLETYNFTSDWHCTSHRGDAPPLRDTAARSLRALRTPSRGGGPRPQIGAYTPR